MLMINKILNKRAEGYLNACTMVICSMLIITISINVFCLVAQRQNLDYFADELLDTAVTYGRIGAETDARYTELQAATGLSPTVSWNTVYFNSSLKTVQLSTNITLDLSLRTYLQGTGTMVQIPVDLTVQKSSLSRRYWK